MYIVPNISEKMGMQSFFSGIVETIPKDHFCIIFSCGDTLYD